MTDLEPKTRLLSRHELSEALGRLDAEHLGDPGEAKTRIWRRPSPAASRPTAPSIRVTEPITELEVVHVLRAQSSAKSSAAGAQTRRILGLSPPLPAWCGRAALGVLLIAGASALGHFALKASEERNAKALARVKSKPAPVMEKITPPPPPPQALPSATNAPSPRVAVDQLISGHLREALDSYRALASAHADEPAYAFVVRQLERELSACDKGDAACGGS